ncbi:hypothetical protein VQZ80_000211 [Salmonella enterica]|nr:hypothetical protein [Salmonella enterica subsp. enterica serovar Carrau]EEJ7416931.1 hypothetical protein [Salmonella enterica subsp. enterica serovar Sandiego]EEK8144556.1 hypothetical protein [Salmonella enterica]HCM4641992.1 hypothetical protein [Salmonella enterica subsp. enterica serovar Panama]EIG1272147.1 hypothetical protein [Salmonella enterica]
MLHPADFPDIRFGNQFCVALSYIYQDISCLCVSGCLGCGCWWSGI